MSQSPRSLDHCVLPVPNLDVARTRYAELGFTVAPQGTHPFGTINACAYFADDTFLEPLAIGDAAQVKTAIADRNVFVARDALYRGTVGDNGFSALVFKTDDAPADHGQFVDDRISAGPMLDFSRAFVDPDGNSGTVSFRLAFAANGDSEAGYFFTCQRINAPAASGRAALEKHSNGVTGIAGITLTAEHPRDHQNFLAAVTQTPVREAADGLVAELRSGDVRVVKGAGPLQLSTICFAVRDLARTAAVLSDSGIAFDRSATRLSVDPAPGQGATFHFEDMK